MARPRKPIQLSDGSLLTIEHGIPCPPQRNRGISAALRTMRSGDSILLDKTRAQAAALAHIVFGKGNYATNSEGGSTRVWRLR